MVVDNTFLKYATTKEPPSQPTFAAVVNRLYQEVSSLDSVSCTPSTNFLRTGNYMYLLALDS